jgi:predicted DNA-binding transcriptional regulator YafY
MPNYRAGQTVLFRYRGGTHGDQQRTVAIEEVGPGYILGFCQLAGDYRRFHIDKIESPILLNEPQTTKINFVELRSLMIGRVTSLSDDVLAEVASIALNADVQKVADGEFQIHRTGPTDDTAVQVGIVNSLRSSDYVVDAAVAQAVFGP